MTKKHEHEFRFTGQVIFETLCYYGLPKVWGVYLCIGCHDTELRRIYES